MVVTIESKVTINGKFYATGPRTLESSTTHIWRWCEKVTKVVLFHQDNAPTFVHTHKSVIAMATVHDCGFELGDHPL